MSTEVTTTTENLPEKSNTLPVIPTGIPATMDQMQEHLDKFSLYDVFLLELKNRLVEGVDYATIEGVDRPSLLQPGAERLRLAFGHTERTTTEIIDMGNGHKMFLSKCEVYDSEGKYITTGEAIVSTQEEKYGKRFVDPSCPECGNTTIKRSKFPKNGDKGWYCYAKIGGCGAEFYSTDQRITSQPVGKVDNPNIADTYHTCLMMSRKRAFVAGERRATGASRYFTQDVEEMNLSGVSFSTGQPRGSMISAADPKQDDEMFNPNSEAYSSPAIPKKKKQKTKVELVKVVNEADGQTYEVPPPPKGMDGYKKALEAIDNRINQYAKALSDGTLTDIDQVLDFYGGSQAWISTWTAKASKDKAATFLSELKQIIEVYRGPEEDVPYYPSPEESPRFP